MSRAAMSDRKRPRSSYYIQRVEVHDLKTLPPNGSRVYMEIVAGRNIRKTSMFKMQSEVTPTWSVGIALDDLQASTLVKFELYQHRNLMQRKCLVWTEKSVSDLISSSDTTIDVKNKADPPSKICALKIFCSDDPMQIAGEEVSLTSAPVQHHRIKQLLDAVWPMEKMIDALADVYPAARIAWSIVLVGINVLKNQVKTDKLAFDLYVTMLSAYKQASQDEVLQKRYNLCRIYDLLFKHTIETSIFIKGYVEKGWARRMFTMNLADKAKEFQEGFEDLQDQLHSGITKENLLVTYKIEEQSKENNMWMLLQDLCPPKALRAKSTCMKGTQIATINYLMDWIARCNGGVLWCSGLAGTGKSSLVGTLHDHLIDHASERNRLSAFIRYDRIEYADASHLITSIAYSLGMYDTRIRTAISAVICRNRAVLSMAADSANNQFRILLQEPLESLHDLLNEGPLVIIIDGIDESDVSKEMLSVLSRGFGPKLPFIRLLVFSRPIEDIYRAFTVPNSAVIRFTLDTGSDEVTHDIKHFIQAEFTSIYNDPLSCDDAFKQACKEEHVIDRLASRASGLFIWAATICRFIGKCPSISRLNALLSSNVPIDAMDSLTTLYKTALNTIASELPGRDNDIRTCVLAVLSAVIFARNPPGMTLESLSIVLSSKDPKPQVILAKLGSVLQTSAKSGGFIQLIHKSFDDFLINPSCCEKRWFIDVKTQKRKFSRQCLLSLTDFLTSWQPKSNIPDYIEKHLMFAPLWYIDSFDIRDINDLHVLFKGQLSKWLQAAFIADKLSYLLGEIRQALFLVNHLTTDMDDSFRLSIYCACQHAELEGLPILAEVPPIRPSEAQVHWNYIFPFPSDLLYPRPVTFSVSADSQFLVAKQTKGSEVADIWYINIGVHEKPSLKPISSFFNSEEALKNSQYDVLGCLVTRSAVGDYQAVIDSESHSQSHWELIGMYPDAALTNKSAFISIYDIQTSFSYHYIFRGLKTYDLLLYSTGIIIIDTQALVLMRINMNTTDQNYIWTRVNEGDAIQPKYSSPWLTETSLQGYFFLSMVEHPDIDLSRQNGSLVVSKDGLTLAHLSQLDSDHQKPNITLRRWCTITGAILPTRIIVLPERDTGSYSLGLRLSANDFLFSILESKHPESFLHIFSSRNDEASSEVIPIQGSVHSLVFLPDDRRISYVTEYDIIIWDRQTKTNVFQHPFNSHVCNRIPLAIMITPDGKTLITMHGSDIRIWRVDAL